MGYAGGNAWTTLGEGIMGIADRSAARKKQEEEDAIAKQRRQLQLEQWAVEHGGGMGPAPREGPKLNVKPFNAQPESSVPGIGMQPKPQANIEPPGGMGATIAMGPRPRNPDYQEVGGGRAYIMRPEVMAARDARAQERAREDALNLRGQSLGEGIAGINPGMPRDVAMARGRLAAYGYTPPDENTNWQLVYGPDGAVYQVSPRGGQTRELPIKARAPGSGRGAGVRWIRAKGDDGKWYEFGTNPYDGTQLYDDQGNPIQRETAAPGGSDWDEIAKQLGIGADTTAQPGTSVEGDTGGGIGGLVSGTARHVRDAWRGFTGNDAVSRATELKQKGANPDQARATMEQEGYSQEDLDRIFGPAAQAPAPDTAAGG